MCIVLMTRIFLYVEVIHVSFDFINTPGMSLSGYASCSGLSFFQFWLSTRRHP